MKFAKLAIAALSVSCASMVRAADEYGEWEKSSCLLLLIGLVAALGFLPTPAAQKPETFSKKLSLVICANDSPLGPKG